MKESVARWQTGLDMTPPQNFPRTKRPASPVATAYPATRNRRGAGAPVPAKAEL